MSDTEKFLIDSVQWLIDRDQAIPADLLQELKAAGIPVNSTKNMSNMLEAIKAEVEAIKLANQPKPKAPPTQIDFEPLISRIDNLIAVMQSAPAPSFVVNVPEQKPPNITIKPAITIQPDNQSRKIKIIRDTNGMITGLED
jgi:hypothetical protein